MQFYEHQSHARSRTGLLLLLYFLALGLIGLVAGALAHGLLVVQQRPGQDMTPHHDSWVLSTVLLTWGLILAGSLSRLSEMRAGGASVAMRMGGSLVQAGASTLEQRRLLNITEEMCIAAGMPVLPVYLLHAEDSINAFAAGWTQDDAVIAVTRGALERLSRDQLQAVVAHEISHVLNRDCALNMRMSGLLHGIMLIATTGGVLMQLGTVARHGSRKDRSALFLLGGMIWLFGSLGALAGRLIQAAISRQREFLADASAVQFTRHPGAVAGALARIACFRSDLLTPYAIENAHLFIAEAGGLALSGAAHPSLFERIQRIMPSFDGDFDALAQSSQARPSVTGSKAPQPGTVQLGAVQPGTVQDSDSIQQPPLGELAEAFELEPVITELAAPLLHPIDQLRAEPLQPLYQAAHEPFSARALILASVISADAPQPDGDASTRAAQLALLSHDGVLVEETERLLQLLADADDAQRSLLFDVALSTLAGLSSSQAQDLRVALRAIATQLDTQSFQGFCLASLAVRHLKDGPPALLLPSKSAPTLPLRTAMEVILGVMAYLGHNNESERQAAFARGRLSLDGSGQALRYPESRLLQLASLDRALLTLRPLPLRRRRALLDAAETTAMHDQHINPAESELLRTLSKHLEVSLSRET